MNRRWWMLLPSATRLKQAALLISMAAFYWLVFGLIGPLARITG